MAHSRKNGKVYRRVLLRDSYREGGKVKHRTIANPSHCSDEDLAANGLRFITAITKPQIETLLKEDVLQEQAAKETVHGRYKDLSQVESAFRTCKTGHCLCLRTSVFRPQFPCLIPFRARTRPRMNLELIRPVRQRLN